jgi:ribonuclease M5
VSDLKYGFIVEGHNDEATVRRVAPDAYFVVTNGTRMNNRVRMDVNQALKVCDEVLILSDPDEAGDVLTQMLLRDYPTLKRVVLDKEKCKAYRRFKLKIGVEHCSDEYLNAVLASFLPITA